VTRCSLPTKLRPRGSGPKWQAPNLGEFLKAQADLTGYEEASLLVNVRHDDPMNYL
jgi:hypothetical protein